MGLFYVLASAAVAIAAKNLTEFAFPITLDDLPTGLTWKVLEDANAQANGRRKQWADERSWQVMVEASSNVPLETEEISDDLVVHAVNISAARGQQTGYLQDLCIRAVTNSLVYDCSDISQKCKMDVENWAKDQATENCRLRDDSFPKSCENIISQEGSAQLKLNANPDKVALFLVATLPHSSRTEQSKELYSELVRFPYTFVITSRGADQTDFRGDIQSELVCIQLLQSEEVVGGIKDVKGRGGEGKDREDVKNQDSQNGNVHEVTEEDDVKQGHNAEAQATPVWYSSGASLVITVVSLYLLVYACT